MHIMFEVHEGICGAHQAGTKMKWLIKRYCYYWLTMLKDCINFAKGCQPCQKYNPIQRVPMKELQPIIKPWPFRGLEMDLIGKIYPLSSCKHCFIVLATDYFTKWVEAIPARSVTQTTIIKLLTNTSFTDSAF